jgi:glutamate synthase (NADPH/NADH) small chain
VTTTGFPERQQPFPSDHATTEANRCLYCFDAPCMVACPTHIDIPGFIKSIATGDDKGAADTIFRSNVMGASCARVCETDALCEGACVLGPTEKPIEIGRLQRHATDVVVNGDGRLPYDVGEPSGKRVAVVGGGPAGLAAAVHLRELGHEVAIFERQPELGGLARYGIIPVREPNEIARWEVSQVMAMGVETHTGVTVGEDLTLETLRDGFDAVLFATGAGAFVTDIGLENADAAGVEDALIFIEKSRTLDPTEIAVGNHVVVVGGGNTAMDAATIAVLLRAPNVTCAYRRTAEDMTAYPTEVDFCLREGVRFEFLAQPVRVITDEAGNATALECARVVPGEPDESGRSRPVVSDERFQIPADHILLATGQSREPGLFQQLDMELHPDGRPVIDEWFATSVDGVWSCGDSATTGAELSVVDAAQQGRLAAWGISMALGTPVPSDRIAAARLEPGYLKVDFKRGGSRRNSELAAGVF